MNNFPNEIRELVHVLEGLECWYVSTGVAAGSTFQLALGKKVERSVPLKNRAYWKQSRRFQGEVGLLVWCAWRLDGSDSPLTSWDDAEASVEGGLLRLVGARATTVEVISPAWDMTIEF